MFEEPLPLDASHANAPILLVLIEPDSPLAAYLLPPQGEPVRGLIGRGSHQGRDLLIMGRIEDFEKLVASAADKVFVGFLKKTRSATRKESSCSMTCFLFAQVTLTCEP
jgi:hypothetical protein